MLFRFSVAVVTFIVGVVTAGAFAALFGFGAARERVRQYNYAPTEVRYGCKSKRMRGLQELPPAPPAPKSPRHARRSTVESVPQTEATDSQVEVTVERR
jgi:hypothetical protein